MEEWVQVQRGRRSDTRHILTKALIEDPLRSGRNSEGAYFDIYSFIIYDRSLLVTLIISYIINDDTQTTGLKPSHPARHAKAHEVIYTSGVPLARGPKLKGPAVQLTHHLVGFTHGQVNPLSIKQSPSGLAKPRLNINRLLRRLRKIVDSILKKLKV